MMKVNKNLLVLLMAIICVAFADQARAAATHAGVNIQNQGTITYEDIFNNQHTVHSNISIFKVKQIYGATISQDQDKIASPSTGVNFIHLLKNIGNGEDTYTVSITNGVSGSGVGLFDATTDTANRLQVVLDANNNGEIDSDETAIATLGSDGTVTLDADEQAMLIVHGTTLSSGNAGATLGVISGNKS